VLLVPGILLYPLVVLQAPEDGLAEAVVVGDVGELRVEQLGHARACGGGVVDLMVVEEEKMCECKLIYENESEGESEWNIC